MIIPSDENLIERDEDTCEVVYVHSTSCGGYCNYSCNLDGQKAAEQINLTEADEERKTHRSIERKAVGT